MGVCYDKAKGRGGYKGGITIPKDEFKEFVEFQKRWKTGRCNHTKAGECNIFKLEKQKLR